MLAVKARIQRGKYSTKHNGNVASKSKAVCCNQLHPTDYNTRPIPTNWVQCNKSSTEQGTVPGLQFPVSPVPDDFWPRYLGQKRIPLIPSLPTAAFDIDPLAPADKQHSGRVSDTTEENKCRDRINRQSLQVFIGTPSVPQRNPSQHAMQYTQHNKGQHGISSPIPTLKKTMETILVCGGTMHHNRTCSPIKTSQITLHSSIVKSLT
jgi:hypothetical protein